MAYKVFEHIDELGRVMRQPTFYISDKPGQYQSHGYSYLYTRTMLKQIEDVKYYGLEEKINQDPSTVMDELYGDID